MKEAFSASNPNIKWSTCRETASKCKLGNNASYEAYLKVPATYDSPSDHFHVYAQKFHRPGATPKTHIIFLAGGPGRIGRSYDPLISQLLKSDEYACYTVDHRGLGKSGLISNDPFSILANNMEEVVKTAP